MLTATKLLDKAIDDMALSQWFLLTMFFVCYECNTQGSTYIKDPTFENLMCLDDQIMFQKVTQSAISCACTCNKTPGCITLIYLHDNQTCFGIKLNNTCSTTSPLPGSMFYTQKKTESTVVVTTTTPMTTNAPTTSTTARTTTEVTSQPPTTSGTTTTDGSDPCKPDKNNVYLPVPGDCHSFYQCSFGTTYTFQCAGSTVFVARLNRCDYNDGSVAC